MKQRIARDSVSIVAFEQSGTLLKGCLSSAQKEITYFAIYKANVIIEFYRRASNPASKECAESKIFR
jgi:hypothetical protein